MTRLDQDTIKAVQRHFEKMKTFDIQELTSALKCSVSNARLKLKQWRAYTSYNQNGRFYSLQTVPKFDQHGLWHHDGAAFSKNGNLKKTIIHLVNTASSGLSGKQLGELLGLLPQSFLHHFRKCSGICREKHSGIYIYFSDDTVTQQGQMRLREQSVCQRPFKAISNLDAIMILVAIIKHHGISTEGIMELPDIKKSKLTQPVIQGFLEHHELIKKNLDSRL